MKFRKCQRFLCFHHTRAMERESWELESIDRQTSQKKKHTHTHTFEFWGTNNRFFKPWRFNLSKDQRFDNRLEKTLEHSFFWWYEHSFSRFNSFNFFRLQNFWFWKIKIGLKPNFILWPSLEKKKIGWSKFWIKNCWIYVWIVNKIIYYINKRDNFLMYIIFINPNVNLVTYIYPF